MMTVIALAAAGLIVGDAPDMRVSTQGLDLARPGHAEQLAERIRAESRVWCARHAAVLTPDHLGDASLCETEMRRRARTALPRQAWRPFARAGGLRALNRP